MKVSTKGQQKMKTHAIIPIFVPHQGCPHDCIFCNQKIITAKSAPPNDQEIIHSIETYLSTLRTNPNIQTIELAFYGGSFTGISMEEQAHYLGIAKGYKDRGIIKKIHLSTRPDYISKKILDQLKSYGVDIIELGVQSFDDEVLSLSNRGHSREEVYASTALIQEYGFTLGIQLMIGLPGDTYEKALYSAGEAVKIHPQIARLYPTVVLPDTELANMYHRGMYTPPSEEELLNITKDMYRILTLANINVIRVGLKSTDYIHQDKSVVAGGYHPAFRQLIEGALAREEMEKQLIELLENPFSARKIQFTCNGKDFSNMVGHKGENKGYFQKKYPTLSFLFSVDHNLPPKSYKCVPLKL